MSQPQPPKDLNELRERASLFISENDLDNEGRVDGGLYTYIDGSLYIRDTANGTLHVFAFSDGWPVVELFLLMVAEMKEQGITNVAQFDEKEYEARLARYRIK